MIEFVNDAPVTDPQPMSRRVLERFHIRVRGRRILCEGLDLFSDQFGDVPRYPKKQLECLSPILDLEHGCILA